MSELETFIRDFRLTPRWAATLFGRSPRTIRRWRRRGRLPRCAQNMIDVCREQAAPINYSMPRGPCIGVQIYEWRERFFGPNWREWKRPENWGRYPRRRL